MVSHRVSLHGCHPLSSGCCENVTACKEVPGEGEGPVGMAQTVVCVGSWDSTFLLLQSTLRHLILETAVTVGLLGRILQTWMRQSKARGQQPSRRCSLPQIHTGGGEEGVEVG